MKRIKLALMLAAAFMGIGGAFAGKHLTAICENEQQYVYLSGLGYVPVFPDYYCYQVPNVCTYYLSNYVPEVYTICKYGDYIEVYNR